MAPQTPIGKLLELSLISAKDLAPVSKSMRPYAVAWVTPDRKLTSRVDEQGNANPTWNEKFVFKIDEQTLQSDTAVVTIEIYALTWLRVVLTGTVTVRIAELVPPEYRKPDKATSTARFFTLKILRPSGRSQGTINVGVSLISGSLRSMPLESEISASTYDGQRGNLNDEKINLWKSRSERTDDRYYPHYPGSVCNDSIVNGEQAGPRKQGGASSAVGGGSLISDIGPSASVVAEAIAKGIYKRKVKKSVVDDGASSVLTEQDSVEGLKTKIERWRTELPPVYDRKSGVPNPKRVKGKAGGDGGGLFSCFGSAMGCEFSISCGGGGNKKKNR